MTPCGPSSSVLQSGAMGCGDFTLLEDLSMGGEVSHQGLNCGDASAVKHAYQLLSDAAFQLTQMASIEAGKYPALRERRRSKKALAHESHLRYLKDIQADWKQFEASHRSAVSAMNTIRANRLLVLGQLGPLRLLGQDFREALLALGDASFLVRLWLERISFLIEREGDSEQRLGEIVQKITAEFPFTHEAQSQLRARIDLELSRMLQDLTKEGQHPEADGPISRKEWMHKGDPVPCRLPPRAYRLAKLLYSSRWRRAEFKEIRLMVFGDELDDSKLTDTRNIRDAASALSKAIEDFGLKVRTCKTTECCYLEEISMDEPKNDKTAIKRR